jgi:hypothetical protein
VDHGANDAAASRGRLHGRPARPPGSAARLGGLVGALLALPAVAVLQTTISSYLRGHVIVDAD